MRRVGLAALVFASSCAGGCWRDDYDFRWDGQYATVYGYGVEDGDLCAGSLRAVDDHIEVVRSYLGVEGPASYEVRWFSNAKWWDIQPCTSETTIGCARGHEAMSVLLPDNHELAHLVVDAAERGRCPPILDEGVAEYLGAVAPGPLYPKPSLRGWDMLLARRPFDIDTYTRAAHFVSFLTETYGNQAVADLCNKLPRESDRGDWDRALRSVIGADPTELFAEYEAYPDCSIQQLQDRSAACTSEPDHVFDEEYPSWSLAGDCDDYRSTNAAWGAVRNATIHRVVEVEQDGWIIVEVKGSSAEVTLITRECAPCSADPEVVVQTPGTPTAHFYPAGRYELVLMYERWEPATVTMTLQTN